MRENIEKAGPELRMFPDPADVFVADQLFLAKHLHPLVSIDLACVDPAWHGWIHLLSPLEPDDGQLGAGTTKYHSTLQAPDTIGFAMEGDRFRMLGDVRFFARATKHRELNKQYEGYRADLEEFCAGEEASFREHRDVYRRTGQLRRLRFAGKGEPGDPVAVLAQLGGEAERGNWPAGQFPVADGETLQPLSPAGNRFHFVATVPGWHYRNHGADGILLFFEPIERLALIGLEWS